MPAEQIDAVSLHALAVELKKPGIISQLILDYEIDGLTAVELDEAAVCELVESKLDQKKVWAAVKQFKQSQEPVGISEPSLSTGTEESTAVTPQWSRRLSDLEQEVWELRSSVEDLRNRPRPPPPSAAPKRLDDELCLDERVRMLEDEILALCDAAPQGSMLAANLPRLYYYRYGRNLDFRSLGFLKLSQLLAKMTRVEFDGSHRALVSKKQPLPTYYLPPDSDLSAGEDLLPSYLLGETHG